MKNVWVAVFSVFTMGFCLASGIINIVLGYLVTGIVVLIVAFLNGLCGIANIIIFRKMHTITSKES